MPSVDFEIFVIQVFFGVLFIMLFAPFFMLFIGICCVENPNDVLDRRLDTI